MFTGIIESCGTVVELKSLTSGCRLTIKSHFDSLSLGESIAVNGVCLTALSETGDCLEFDLSPETLKLTTLGNLKVGQRINLERAMLSSTRMGGHYVSGHVDTTAIIKGKEPKGDFLELTVGEFNERDCRSFLLPKGSITLDGVSLTINSVNAEQNSISLMLVPHTLEKTTLGESSLGQQVNVEFDYLTRIIAHQLAQILPQVGVN